MKQKQMLTALFVIFSLLSIYNLEASDWRLQKKLYDAIAKDDVKKIEDLLAQDPSMLKKKIKYHGYPVMDAMKLRAVKALKYLVEKGANIHKKEPKTGNSVLHYAAISKFKEKKLDDLLNYLVNENKIDVNIKNKDGITPFLYPCTHTIYLPASHVMLPVIDVFKKYKADLNAKDKYGKTVLHYLAGGFIMQFDPDKTNINTWIISAKHLAGQKEANINATDNNKRTPLVAFLVKTKGMNDAKKVDFITCLMEYGAKTNIKSKHKEKALRLVDKKGEAFKAMKKKYKKKKRK